MMKQRLITYFVMILITVGCSTGANNKVENAVKSIEEKRFKDNGEKIESIAIDSLKYEPASMQNFYSDHSDNQVNVLETYSERLQTVTDTTNSPMASALQAKAQRQLDIFKELQNLSLTADTTKNLYSVEYRLKAKTDKNSYDKKVQKYLYQNNLNEVVLDPKYRDNGF